MSVIIAPSILSGDFARLGEEVKKIEQSGADWVHCDVMDGHFVPNLTFGHKMIADIKKCTALPLEVHLMIDKPERYLDAYIDAGANYLSFHVEATDDVTKNLEHIRSRGVNPGIAIKPATKVKDIAQYLDKIAYIIVMGVDPGFGGQGFIPGTKGKMTELKGEIARRGLDVLVELDGGLNSANAQELFAAGMDVAVSGSAFFAAGDAKQYVKFLREVANK